MLDASGNDMLAFFLLQGFGAESDFLPYVIACPVLLPVTVRPPQEEQECSYDDEGSHLICYTLNRMCSMSPSDTT